MTDFQIYYIHGFGSTPESSTTQMLREHFTDVIGLDYDHNDPVLSICKMIAEINDDASKSDKYPIIVGSSLGGWYAEHLTRYVVADYILYNPSTNPEITLSRHGLSQDVLYKYKSITSPYKFLPTSRSVLLSEDDEIIDYKVALNKYKEIAQVMFTNGGHRMTDENMRLIADRINILKNQLP